MSTYLPIAGMVDLAAEQARLGKELEAVQRELTRSEGLLAKESFVAKAPPDVVAKERARVQDLHEKQRTIQAHLAALA